MTDTEDRECLLLDEYSGSPADDTEAAVGPSNTDDFVVDDTTVLSESDQDASSGDDSTDIDAVVKEYQDRVQVQKEAFISLELYILVLFKEWKQTKYAGWI